MKRILASLFLFFVSCGCFHSQNETNKWYFGQYAGLDFMTSPPSNLLNSSMSVLEGCSSIADQFGNLLFYTDGITIWNQNHTIMANGTGLWGGANPIQSSIILKQPNSNSLYYIFTRSATSATNSGGLHFTIVDMSLAAGVGSVTTKNSPLYSTLPIEAITGIRHCNGIDFWIVIHELNSSNFRTYLLTSAGASSTPVISSVGPSITGLGAYGSLKISPNGKKIGLAYYDGIYLFDFNNSTGVVSNTFQLSSTISGYGCEFSPDCSRFYCTQQSSGPLFQWDLCAGNSNSIIGSLFSFTASAVGSLQLASNGKIYVSRSGFQPLGIINNPNNLGVACNFVLNGQSVTPNTAIWGLPNFIGSYFLQRPPPLPFTFTVNNSFGCQAVAFTSSQIQNTVASCAASGYSINNVIWTFGDPLSGTANSSTLSNPIHAFSSIGTYTVQQILYYDCSSDTLRQVVNVNQSCISVQSQSITCSTLGSASVTAVAGIGPFSYTWLPTVQTNSIATGLYPGTYTVLVFDAGNNQTYTTTTTFISFIPLTGTVVSSNSLSCFGSTTGTATVINLSGGSLIQNYIWTNGSISFTSASPTSLSSGQWSVNVTDALTGCQINQSFFISQPPASTLNLSANTSTACVNTNIVLTGTNSGGTPGYTYTWTNGPALDTYSVSQANGGTYVYTLASTDANNCLTSNTIALDFINNPVLAISDVSICPLAVGTLTVSGASTYSWHPPSTSTPLSVTGATLIDSPSSNSEYTVVGSDLGCTAAVTTSIILFSSPVPVLNHNSPVCNGQTLQFSGSGGLNYLWSGPLGFNSNSQSTVVSTAAPNNSGVYNLTVTSVEGCTASTSATLVVNPTPTISATGATVCTSQTLNLSASSLPGSSFSWSGTNNFSSALQNPFIVNPAINRTGIYTVVAISAVGCTNVTNASVLVIPPPSLTVALSSPSLCYQAFNGSPNTITLTSNGANSYTLFTPNLIGVTNPAGPTSSISSLPPYSSSISIGTATLIGSNGVCSSSTTALFTVVPNPTVTINSFTPVICAGQNFTYTAFGADSYTWGPNSPNLTTYTHASTVASPSVNALYSVVGGSMGCNSPTQTSTITVFPLPTISLTPASPTICMNEKITLTANGTGSSFIWSPYQSLNDIVGQSVIASPLQTQTYSVVVSVNNCTNTANITVTVFPLPIPVITVLKSTVCVNEEVKMQGSGGVTYDWSGPLDRNYQGEEFRFAVGSMQYAGVYTLNITDIRGCKNSTTTAITVNNLPQGDLIGFKSEGCVPFCNQYQFASISSVSTTSTWQINNQNFGDKFSHCFHTPGTFTLTGNLYDALTTCTNKYNLLVTVHPKPEADFVYAPLKPVENFDEVIFTNTSTGEEQNKWYWFFNDNKGYTSDQKNTSYLYPKEGQYPVAMIVSNKWHCADTIMKLIKIEPDFNIYVPNVFTPNADDRNDIFYPVITGEKLYDLKIYNRWGAMIFHSTSTDSGWDGTYDSEECKQDVYQWKVLVSTKGGEAREFNGHVSLVR